MAKLINKSESETKSILDELHELKQIYVQGNSILVCPDCKHNCLSFEPASEGACFCGCH